MVVLDRYAVHGLNYQSTMSKEKESWLKSINFVFGKRKAGGDF